MKAGNGSNMVAIDQNLCIVVDQEPNMCPVCNKLISPNRSGFYKQNRKDLYGVFHLLEVVYECPSSDCGHLFIGHFEKHQNVNAPEYKNTFFTLIGSSPKNFERENFDEKIEALSPQFTEIFNQAANADTQGLKEICGMGYRKALEFLIKDYCIAQHPNEGDKIRSMNLMSCINQYILDANVKECATRAAWLGNDETHYERRWEDKDLNDLKLLIRLSTNWIVNSILTDEYMKSMKKK